MAERHPRRTGSTRPGVAASWGSGAPDSLADLWATVRRFKVSVIALTLVGLALGLAYSMLSSNVYQATTVYFAEGPQTTDGALEADTYVQRRINSYVGVVTSESVAQIILDDTGLEMSQRALMKEISASVDPDTVLMTVKVQDTSRQRALEIAQSLDANLDDIISGLEGGDASTEIRFSAISGPTLANGPVAPNTRLNVALGLLAGLALGLVQAVVRGHSDRTFREREDLSDDTESPVLAVVPYDRKWRSVPVLRDSHTQTRGAEAFRHLRTNLRFLHADRPAQVVVVSSSVEDEGKTSTAANLAITLAMSGDRVLLIDADLRKPSLGQYLDVESAAGLTNVLVDRVPVDSLIQSWPRHGLEVLASGPLPPNPSELLGGERMEGLIRELRESYDVVVLDSPPILPVTDAAVLATKADGVLLAVRFGSTKRDLVHQSLEMLENLGVRVLGTVLTMSRGDEAPEASSYYHRNS